MQPAAELVAPASLSDLNIDHQASRVGEDGGYVAAWLGETQTKGHVAFEVSQLAHLEEPAVSRLHIACPVVRGVRVAAVDGDLQANLARERHRVALWVGYEL